MKYPIRYILLLLAGLFSFTMVAAQCSQNNFAISSDTVCGGELVNFSIVNPTPAMSYFWSFGEAGGAGASGTDVTYTYPFVGSDRNYTVTVFNGQGSCQQTVTVLATPDASLEPLTGLLVSDRTIAYCNATSDFPEFELTVQNTSSTASENNSYTIDWGDGTPAWTGSDFNTATHTYTAQGQYFLTLTVSGNLGCSSASSVYEIFNSSDPGGSIVNTTNTITTCFPNTIGYPILGTENNIPGTTYEISISGVLMGTFSHPPPDTFYHTFDASSCGQGYAPFDPDEYVVQMEVISPCQDKLSFVSARLGTRPEAEFAINPQVICPGSNLLLTNTSRGSVNAQDLCDNIAEANWMIEPRTYNIISGDTINSENLEIKPLEATQYIITMWVENMCGVDTVVKVADMGAVPTADAIAQLDQPQGCAPAVATFTNLSTKVSDDPTVSYYWGVDPPTGTSFVNTTFSSSFEPHIQFAEPGTYTVSLNVYNVCGAPSWDTVIEIRSLPSVEMVELGNYCTDSFTWTPDALISGEVDQVSWLFDGGIPSSWSGAEPPPIQFAGTGDYSISVTATNICGAVTETLNFSLSDPVGIDAGGQMAVCDDSPPLILSAQPAGGIWSGAGLAGDTFDVRQVAGDSLALTYTFDNGICTISDDLLIMVVRQDDLTAGPDETICQNLELFTLAGNFPEGGTWIGNGITVPSAGSFDPTAVDTGVHVMTYVYTDPDHGCADSAYKQVEVLAAPEITIQVQDTVCEGTPAWLEAEYDGQASVTWNFGDGNQVTGSGVSHLYQDPGTYEVFAQVTNIQGCAGRDSATLTIATVPEANFTIEVPVACDGVITGFLNQSSGWVTEYLWNLGNGYSSNSFEPQDIEYQPGLLSDTLYPVMLTASNWCGSHTYTDTVRVSKVPVALFGTNVNTICPGEELFINNISYNSPDGFIWDFGNGSSSLDEDPAPQVYPSPLMADTVYTVTLVAYNQCGSDTLAREVLAKTREVVAFFNTDPLQGCAPLTIDFINYSTVGTFCIWDFGDGNTATLDTISHVFGNSGVFNVSLVADNGCSSDTARVDVNVLPTPEVQFESAASACHTESVQFENRSTGAFGYVWGFGNGNISFDVHPVYEYPLAGTYQVTLFGENQYGCLDSAQGTIEIVEQPLAAFDVGDRTVCAGSEVNFTDMSTAATSHIWDFGDGNQSYIPSPVNRYVAPGIYDVTLVVGNRATCFDTLQMPGLLEVVPAPVADFDHASGVPGVENGAVNFTNLSFDAQDFSWSFGDGTVSDESNPVHRYASSGRYEVILTAINAYGCTDTYIQYLDVEYVGRLYVPNAFSPVMGSQSEASIFLPKGVALLDYELEIYSSYGELLWRTTALEAGQPAEGWDGLYKGKMLPQDVYVWKIRATFENGLLWQGAEINGRHSTVGTVTLIR